MLVKNKAFTIYETVIAFLITSVVFILVLLAFQKVVQYIANNRRLLDNRLEKQQFERRIEKDFYEMEAFSFDDSKGNLIIKGKKGEIVYSFKNDVVVRYLSEVNTDYVFKYEEVKLLNPNVFRVVFSEGQFRDFSYSDSEEKEVKDWLELN